MNKTYTLKELADIGAKAANLQHTMGIVAREEFTKAILDAIGYEFPKDEEREAFERWQKSHTVNPDDAFFEVWKAGREELRRSQSLDKKPTEPVEPAWIPWNGGECPLPDTVKRWEIRYRDEFHFDKTDDFLPSDLRWSHCGNNSDIIAYRVWE